MLILGTGGHIDHGKTSLIRRLTGTNTDRLAEEQQRGMTIDLGFASLQLPSGKSMGVIDVPGHHRFVKNMLAGVGGIHVFLLVVAADDGWMPQTEEHKDIVDLLGIRQGVVAVTKLDLVDRDWLDLVMEDIRDHLQGTALTNIPIVPVSNTTGEGIDEVVAAIARQADAAAVPVDCGDPLLWIDRVFSIKGAGTVITGTLTEGPLQVDQNVEIGPIGLEGRIRGLQVHEKNVQIAEPGSRTAVNLAGLDSERLHRGMYLAAPRRRQAYKVVDVELRLLPNKEQRAATMPAFLPLRTLQSVKLYRGSLETMARIKLLQADEIRPGESCLAQLTLETPAPFRPGDAFIIRHPSQDITCGGGTFLQDGIPARGRQLRLVGRAKYDRQWPFLRRTPYLNLSELELVRAADPEARQLLLAANRPFWRREDLQALIGTVPHSLLTVADLVLHPQRWQELKEHVTTILAAYHRQKPMQAGYPKEELRQQMGVPDALFQGMLDLLPELRETANVVHLAEHKGALTDEQRKQSKKLAAQIHDQLHEPATLAQLQQQGWDKHLLDALLFQKKLQLLEGQFVVTPTVIDTVIDALRGLDSDDGFTVAAFRDNLGTTRKFALAYLDYFDRQRITVRDGDVRHLSAKWKHK